MKKLYFCIPIIFFIMFSFSFHSNAAENITLDSFIFTDSNRMEQTYTATKSHNQIQIYYYLCSFEFSNVIPANLHIAYSAKGDGTYIINEFDFQPDDNNIVYTDENSTLYLVKITLPENEYIFFEANDWRGDWPFYISSEIDTIYSLSASTYNGYVLSEDDYIIISSPLVQSNFPTDGAVEFLNSEIDRISSMTYEERYLDFWGEPYVEEASVVESPAVEEETTPVFDTETSKPETPVYDTPSETVSDDNISTDGNASETNKAQTESVKSSGLPVPAIVGIIVGVIAVLAVIILIIKKKK